MTKTIAAAFLMLLAGCNARPEPGGQAANETSNSVAAQAEEPQPTSAGESPPAAGSGTGNAAVSACLVQNGKRIADNSIRAIGTEPFWGARIVGRCVTYSTPEDQAGTRVWTRFEGAAEKGRWAGALDGRPFVMETEPQPGCSDGMSDNRYPIAVKLTVRGEERTGCAEPR